MSVTPFQIDIPDSTLNWIRDRVRDYPWHEMPVDGGWAYGTNLDYMKDLCAYWLAHFDWRAQEAALNRFPQFTAPVDGMEIHFIHLKGKGPNPTPLIISHGWPGSIVEFLDVLEPLADPASHGGDPADAFEVVAPSLPGYGFSDKPAKPIGPRRVAAYFNGLMTTVFGHECYLAQGGDWGSPISSWLGLDHAPACRAIHINMFGVRPMGVRPETDAERAWEKRARKIFEAEGSYYRQQSTKPQTLSYAMMDSPVGVAAWIIEKFHTWSDTAGGDLGSCYTKDRLLANIMIYLVTRTFNTASWMYRGFPEEGSGFLPDGKRVEVPVGVANFQKEFINWPPRSYAEKSYNITHWTDMPKGVHFAAMEQPDLFVADLRKFARGLK